MKQIATQPELRSRLGQQGYGAWSATGAATRISKCITS